jgi:hypothetical protein
MFNYAEELPSERTGRTLLLMGVALLIVLAVVGAYVYWNRVPPVAEGRLPGVRAYLPHHVDAKAADAEAASQGADPLVVLAPVRITNVGKKPLTVSDLMADLTLGDQEYHSLDIAAEDFPRLFQYYPELAQSQEQQPVLRRAVIQPGQTLQGLLVFNYPLTLAQWGQRKSFVVTITFEHEKNLVLTDPSLSSSPSPGE